MHDVTDQFIQNLFDLYGPIVVFGLLVIAGVGLHLPEDLIVIPAGYEIAAGDFPMFWTILAAYLGVTGGDTLWFFVCRCFGGRLVATHWFRKNAHPKRILQVKELYDRHGVWVLLASRFIPGSRTVGVAVGGLVHLSWGVFLLVELSTAVLSVGFQLGLGYAAQRGTSSSGPLHWVTMGVGAIMVVTIVIGIITWWRRSKQGAIHVPRARVSWLRELRTGRSERNSGS
ncbi:MAG: DedA family protein [Phycisphaera sp.]|nr:DedA family protein [Phycisphaera sp.]